MANERLRDEPSDLPRLALALAKLALLGFSLVLASQMSWLSMALRTDFTEHNTLGVHGRLLLLLSLAAGIVLPIVAGFLVVWRKGEQRATCILERAATLSAPFAALFVVPGLFLSQIARDKPLYYLIVLSAFGLTFDALLTMALGLLGEAQPGDWLYALRARVTQLFAARPHLPSAVPALLVLVAAAGYAMTLARYGVSHHRMIQHMAPDIGVIDNVMMNLLHGHFFRAPAQFGSAGGNYLTVHAEYGALLFLPFYALRPGSETLLWMQAIIAALAAIPLYFAAARQLGRGAAVWLSFAYLLVAPLHGALIAGFSWLPAVTLFSFTLYYAIESERRWLLIAALIALLSINEAGPLNVLGLGGLLLASRKNVRLGLGLVLLAVPVITWNLLLSVRGSGAVEHPPLVTAVTSLWNNPVYFVWDLARASKVTAVLNALAPLCLLPLLELSVWPLLIPGFLYTAANSIFWPNSSAAFLSSVVWVPGCFLGLLCVLKKRQLRVSSGQASFVAAIVALTVTVLSHSYNYGAFLREDGFGGVWPETVRMSEWGKSRYQALQKAIAPIPATASVSTTNYLLSSVSARLDVCDAARPCARPDYILLSSREAGSVRGQLAPLFASHQYQLVVTSFDEFYLFRRGTETPATQSALARLGLGSN